MRVQYLRVPSHRKLTDEQVLQAYQDLHDGELWRAVASKYGVGASALVQRFNKMNLAREYRYRVTKPSLIPSEPSALGYLAGIMDGEGSIVRRGGLDWALSMGNTDKALVLWCAAIAGHWYTKKTPSKLPSHKQQYSWWVYRRVDVLGILLAIEPYLIVKKALALLAISELGATRVRLYEQRRPLTLDSESP